MKYTTEDLIFAVQVRELASQIRNGARAEFMPKGVAPEEIAAARDLWNLNNPLSSFVPAAMESVMATAFDIQNYLKR